MKTLQASVDSMLVLLLKDLQHAEEQLCAVLPTLWDSTASPGLAGVLRGFLHHSMEHCATLAELQQRMGDHSASKRWAGMDATILETLHAMDVAPNAQSRALMLISGSQRIKGLKIAAYGTARSLAEARGANDIADALADILATEMEEDLALTEAAHQMLHPSAAL